MAVIILSYVYWLFYRFWGCFCLSMCSSFGYKLLWFSLFCPFFGVSRHFCYRPGEPWFRVTAVEALFFIWCFFSLKAKCALINGKVIFRVFVTAITDRNIDFWGVADSNQILQEVGFGRFWGGFGPFWGDFSRIWGPKCHFRRFGGVFRTFRLVFS